MTKEEAIERLEWYQCHAETKEDADAFDMAISALRLVSREQVEKVRGEWTTLTQLPNGSKANRKMTNNPVYDFVRKEYESMKCDNERCISNADGYCEIPEHYVHLDENGVCTNMLLDERSENT